ncbi:MAG: GNAT family N-acetyltransferase [Candidatus Hermodarchaeota archaeon]
MERKFYTDIDEFNELVFAFLVQREAENNLILAILDGLKKDIHRYGQETPLLFLISENDLIKLVSIRTPPFDLIISYTDDLNTIDLLIEKLIQRGEILPGVLSFKDAADKFSRIWAKKSKIKSKLLRSERVYKLEKVAENTIGDKVFINATKKYETFVLKSVKEMMLEALIEVSEERVQETVQFFRNQMDEGRSTIYLLIGDDNNPLSIVNKAGKTPNGNFINFVYTPPHLRKKGYATEIVAKISKMLLEEGNKYCFLFTDLSNPTSNSIYQKVGYRPVIDMNHYKFTSI